MANDKTLSFGVEFISKGLSKIDGDLVNTFKRVGELEQAASVVFKGNDVALVKAQKGYKALSKEVQSLSEEVKATTDDFDKFKRSAAADDKNNPTWKAFTETLANLNTKLAAVTGTFKGFNDQLSGTAKGANVNIQNLLTTMKSLGVSDTILSSLKDKLASVNTILTTTGKGTQLNKLSRDMEKYYANIIKVEEATKKLSSLDIKSPDKNKVLSTLTTSKDKIASGDLNQQQINALLKKSDDLYKSLSVTQSELLTKQKEAKSLLQSDITLLEAKRNLLVASAAAQKNSASKEDLKAAEKVVALLDDEIAKRKALLTLTPTAVTPKATATYVSKITAGTSNTAGLVDKAIETKEDVNLSKNFVNAREAAKSLLLEVDRIGASLRNTSSGTINAIKAQIDAISVNLNNKTKGSAGSPASASAELTDLNKKLGLLKLINEYENNVEANANLNTADKTLGLANLESLRNELVITGSSITILKDKFNSFKKSLDNKVAVDVGFDQTIRKYTEQIGALERLKNAKTNWATDKSLLAAQEQIDKLGRELTKVREEKAKFDASFATSTNLSTTVKEGSASLQNLNKSLVSSTEATRHLNAQLSETSFSKWIQNIGGRVLAYSSLYMGITQVTQAMSAGVAYTLEYDQAIHTLSAVLDMSSESAGRLEKRLAGLSVKFGGTLKDINEAALTLGRAGFDKAEVATATENIIKMARLTGDSFATSASALITYKEVFGDVKDAITGTTPSVEDLSNTLAYMANQSRMSTQDIGTFSNYALAAARSSGMTANAVSAMAISFSNAGVNASTIGTQIRRFSSVLSETSGEVTSFFKAIGTDQEIMIARMKMGTEESNKAMAEFVAKLKGLSDNDFGRITRGMDILALQSITLLRNNADNFFLHLRKLNAGVNGEIDKANFITESYAITWEKLGNSLALSFKNTVGALLPFAQAATEFAIGALDKFNYTITAIRENWDKFRIAMQVVLGALAGAAIVGAAIRITAALGTITAGATGASAAMAVLQGLMTAISRHPIAAIVVGITSVAIGMAAAFGESKDAVVTLDDKITKTQDKIRELIKLKQNASVTEAYKIELKITAAQLEVDNLTKALNINSAILDSKSSVKDATIMMTAYANQKNPELLAVSGGKAQSAMTSALDANIASLTGILKATNEKDIKRITEISDFISQLELAKKSIQSADFSTVANQKNMDTWALSLKNMTTQTDVLAERFKLMAQNPNATGPAVIPNAKGIYSLKDDTAANQKEMLKVTEANYARAGADLKYTQEMINNTQFLATQISRLEKGFDKQYQITSSGRAGDKGQHGVSGAVDIQLANVDEGKRMQKYMEQNPDIFKGVGQVILEVMEATGKAVMHIAVDASGKGMRFYQGTVANMKTTLSGPAYSPTQKFSPAATTSTASPAFNAPNLVQDKGAISVKSGATQVQTLVSPEYINLLTSAASKYESLYNSNVNVTGKTKELSAELANTISKLSKTEIAMLQNTIDAVPEAGKALARQFMNDITKAGSDPIAAGKAVEKVTLEAENYSKTANPDLEKQKALDAVVSASKKYVESHQQILTLTEAKARLDTLGLLDKHVMTKLLKEDNVQVREVTRLMAEQLTAEQQLNAVKRNSAFVVTDLQIAQSKTLSDTNLQAESAQRLKVLKEQELELVKEIDNFNKYDSGNKKRGDAIKEKEKKLTQDITDEYKLQQGLTKDIIKDKTAETIATARQLDAQRTIAAEYENFVNRTSGYEKDLEVLREIERLLQAGFTEPQARVMIGDKLKTQREDGQDAITGTNFTSMGMGNFSGLGMKQNEQNINKIFDTQQATLTAQKDNLGQELGTNAQDMSGMTPGSEDEIAAMEQRKALLQQFHDTEFEMQTLQNQRMKALEAAKMGAHLAQAQQTFDALSNIANVYYLLSGNKSKGAFKAMQALSVATTIVKTYEAAQSVYAATASIPYVGPYLAPVAAAGAVAAGMQQVAQIKAQTFHTGGYVSNDNRAGLRSDEVPATLQTGEYVLSRKDMAAIKGAGNAPQATQQAPASNSEVVIVNSLDPSVIEAYLTSRAGRQVINNAVK